MTELQTGVDELMELVRKKKKLSVAEAAQALKQSEDAIQAWVDFLVEEHVLGIEYKFTTPYIYVHSEERLQEAQQDDNDYELADFREVFYAYAREKNMPREKLPHLWRAHLNQACQSLKGYFLEECKRQGIKNGEQLFTQYLSGVIHGT